jgi:large subunit ribosomal protein L10
MEKERKEELVAELTERLQATDTLIVADYRGLTNKELEGLRARLIEHGARFRIVKNTLTRRAAEAASFDSLLALLDGPTAIAFIEADGDPAAVAKALADTARDTKLLALRGGVLQGVVLSGEQVEELSKLPPVDVLRGQLVGAIVAPLTQLLTLLDAPVRDLVGLIDARIEQLNAEGAVSGSSAEAEEPAPPAAADESDSEGVAVMASSEEAESDTADSAEAESAGNSEED